MTAKAKLETAAAVAAIIGTVVAIMAWLMPFDPIRPSPLAKASPTGMPILMRNVSSPTPPSSSTTRVETWPSPTRAVVEPTITVWASSSRPAGRIAFQSYDGFYQIWTMNADGTDARRLTNDPTSNSTPAWSPNGRYLTFTASYADTSEIYLIDADGMHSRNLTQNPAKDDWSAWSPDGQTIAFGSDRDGDFEIYLMNADGTNQRALTKNSSVDKHPTWASDGRFIAYECSWDNVVEQICLMNADGTNQHVLVSPGYVPAWSPDGQSIAFYTAGHIAVMSPDGSALREVAWGGDPTWSPDSRFIAFRSPNPPEIYVMNVEGTNIHKIADGCDPAWSPK